MIAITGFLLCALVAMLLFADTDFGSLCHRELVERPVERLRNLRRVDLIFAIVLLAVGMSGGELFYLLGPEFFAAYAMDVALYFDVMLVAYAGAAVTRVRHASAAIRQAVSGLLPQRRARRRSPRQGTRPQRPPANDDEDGPGKWSQAA